MDNSLKVMVRARRSRWKSCGYEKHSEETAIEEGQNFK